MGQRIGLIAILITVTGGLVLGRGDLKHTNKLRSYVRGVRFGLFNGFESDPRGTILDKMLFF